MQVVQWRRVIGLPAELVKLLIAAPEHAVMALMGWAGTGMAKRCQHVTGLRPALASAGQPSAVPPGCRRDWDERDEN